jgi:CHAT domain-containing protein/tetratricopeptide (TPR) repeat protein
MSADVEDFNFPLKKKDRQFLDSLLTHLEEKLVNAQSSATTFGEAAVCVANDAFFTSDFSNAEQLINKAILPLARQPFRNDWTNIVLANVYSYKGLIKYQSGQLEDSQQNHELAIATYNLVPDSLAMGKISEYQNLCRVLVNFMDTTPLVKILQSFKKGIETYKNIRTQNPDIYQIWLASYTNLEAELQSKRGMYYDEKNQFGAGQNALQEATKLNQTTRDSLLTWRKKSTKPHYYHEPIQMISNQLMLLYLYQNDPKNADSITALLKNLPQSVFSLNARAIVAAWQKDTIEALKYTTKALKLTGWQNISDSIWADLPPLTTQAINNLGRVFEPLRLRGELFSWLSHFNTDSTYKLRASRSSRQTFLTALDALDTLRSFYVTEDYTRITGRTLNIFFDRAADATYRVYELTKTDADLDILLHTIERGKAFVLRQKIIRSIQQSGIAKRDKNLVKQVFEAQKRIELTHFGTKSNKLALLETLTQARTHLQRFRDSLRFLPFDTEGGRYHRQQFDDYKPSIKDIRHRFLASPSNPNLPKVFISLASTFLKTLVVVITPTRKTVFSIPMTEGFSDTLLRLQSSLDYRDTEPNNAKTTTNNNAFVGLADGISAKLLYPIFKTPNLMPDSGEILLSSDGIFQTLPLDILFYEKPVKGSLAYPRLPYLFKRYALGHTLSLGTLNWQKQLPPVAQGKGLGIFSGDYGKDSQSGLQPLDSLTRAARQIARLAGTKTLINGANKADFLQKIQDFNGLLLIMHGDTVGDLGEYGLYFDSKKDTPNNAYLTTKELSELPLSNLAFAYFAACKTHRGVLDVGEGVLGLARGAQYAGCRSVVATLNSVPDNPSHLLTLSFFEQLQNGRTALPYALQRAKKQYISQCEMLKAHPRFFANFIIFVGY